MSNTFEVGYTIFDSTQAASGTDGRVTISEYIEADSVEGDGYSKYTFHLNGEVVAIFSDVSYIKLVRNFEENA